MALRKRLFCNAKHTLLPCKTYAFGTPNNRFCNTLINNKLHNKYSCKKYLHHYHLLFTNFQEFQSLSYPSCKCNSC
ncbi:hypothetical protein BWX39_00260 [Prevotella intermedia ATCC 25611 = DSM 20706]|nr:hypothetical protein BWX39_00260 [Prevotella intermedia ATCC 25611 = DSM 20706]